MTMNDQSETQPPKMKHDGIWIGIDLGTTNSACAVWDSARGGAKWVRLRGISEKTGTKVGRIMPSVVRFKSNNEEPLVGFPALQGSPDTGASKSSLVRSVKRLLGKRFEDLDAAWVKTLDFDIRKIDEADDAESLQLILRTDSNNETVIITAQQVLAVELKAIREACQTYLDRYRISKNLKVPGAGDNNTVENVVVGVPAHYSHRHIELMKEACREAGFHGHVSTCLESTAAAMAYGLTLQERSKRSSTVQTNVTIMVVDMGGGTTDITIASNRKNNESPDTNNENDHYRVLVTEGDDKLGGDDIDQAIMEYCLNQVQSKNQELSEAKNDALKMACRKAKESLCHLEEPSSSETIVVDCNDHNGNNNSTNKEVVITQEILNGTILTPWLERARELILEARKNLNRSATTSDLSIDEVILVGGTTRVPAIRQMIQEIFPEIELSSSLNPMSSVAQGLAVQAAIVSKQIPMHQLKSAMMLDCVPHAIGVQLPSADGKRYGGDFVEIIPRNTLLPAMGSATFVLANKYQPGVSIRAVEEVGDNKYEPMSKEDFSFVLRKLSGSQFESMTERKIQVGMKLDTDGRFVVSVFDENDPEQVRKRDRFERLQKGEVVGELDYIKDMIMAESNDITKEQVTLVIILISVFVLYISIKIAFTDPLEDGSTILG